MTKRQPTFEEVSALLSYEPETGVFRWRVARTCGRGRVFAAAGAEAGTVDKSTGYRRISINYVHCYAHRLAWLLTHRNYPAGDIDHINGVRADNRLCNLRDVPHQVNQQNRRQAPKQSASGVLGVWRTRSGRWKAGLQHPVSRSLLHVGTFDTVEEARRAHLSAKRALHEGCTI